jgi:phosphate-selective porin OprO/OprP
MRHPRLPTLAALISPVLAIAVAPQLHAADGDVPAPAPSVEDRLQALDQEIKVLKRKQEIAAEEAAAKAKDTANAPPRVTANAKDGFTLGSADGAFKLRLGGYAQVDGRFFLDDDNSGDAPRANLTDNFTIRRARVSLDGGLYGLFDFRVQFDLGGSAPQLVDSYVTAKLDPAFRVTAGRFKSPVGLEWLQIDSYAAFVERGLPTNLVPARDTGAQVSGDLWSGVASYAAGIFSGATDGTNRDSDSGDDKEVVGRLFLTPFKNSGFEPLAGLGFGIGGSVGTEDPVFGTNAAGAATVATSGLPKFVSAGQNTFFSYSADASGVPGATGTAVARGRHLRYSPQLYWAWGPWSLLGEYALSKQRVERLDTANPAGGGRGGYVANQAWQVETGYVLTGDKASFNGVVPDAPVGSGGWGAWEVVARFERLIVDAKAFDNGFASIARSARSATGVGVGINWWLNRNLKIQLDYERTAFEGGANGSAVDPDDRQTEHVIQSRIQVLF